MSDILMRVIAALMVVFVVSVNASAHSRPILAKPTLFGIGVAYLVDLMADGCGPGWHGGTS